MLFILQLRETIFNFAQKELAPKAYEIDKNDDFKEIRVSMFMITTYLCFLHQYFNRII